MNIISYMNGSITQMKEELVHGLMPKVQSMEKYTVQR